MRRFAIVALLFGCSSSDAPPATTADDGVVADSSTTIEETAIGTDGETVDTTVTTADTSTPSDAPADSAIAFGPYPAGPYGNKLGDTMQNLVWEGYVNVLADAISNTKPYVASVDMDKLRRDAKKGYALVHVSEFG